jgi:hypothetical protein
MLKEKGIVPYPNTALQSLDSLKQHYDLSIKFEAGSSGAGFKGGYPQRSYTWNRINVVVKNSEGKEKIVARGEEYISTDNEYAEIDVAGYYKSPFEDRIALFFYDKRYRENGRIISGKPRLAGCHLFLGF